MISMFFFNGGVKVRTCSNERPCTEPDAFLRVKLRRAHLSFGKCGENVHPRGTGDDVGSSRMHGSRNLVRCH